MGHSLKQNFINLLFVTLYWLERLDLIPLELERHLETIKLKSRLLVLNGFK